MDPLFSLFLLAVLATVVRVDATPLVTIREPPLSMAITSHLKVHQLGGQRFADVERARAKKAIKTAITASKKGKVTTDNISATDALVSPCGRSTRWYVHRYHWQVQYLATVGVGYPATNCSLVSHFPIW